MIKKRAQWLSWFVALKKLEVGIGLNYAGFSDDLGIMDYTEQRGYLRITGVLE